MKINTESLSEIWIRPLYAFYKTASWWLFNFLYTFFFFHFILLVEFLKGADELSCLNWLSPLWRVQLMLTFWLCRGKNPLMHCVTWISLVGNWLKAYRCLVWQMACIMALVWWAACWIVKLIRSIIQLFRAATPIRGAYVLHRWRFGAFNSAGWKHDSWVGWGFNNGRQSWLCAFPFRLFPYPLPSPPLPSVRLFLWSAFAGEMNSQTKLRRRQRGERRGVAVLHSQI